MLLCTVTRLVFFFISPFALYDELMIPLDVSNIHAVHGYPCLVQDCTKSPFGSHSDPIPSSKLSPTHLSRLLVDAAVDYR